MVFLGFALGTWLATSISKKEKVDPNLIIDAVMWILVFSIIGARITYIAFHLDEFQGRWLDTINPFQSDGTIGIAGLVVLGGFVAAVPAIWFFAKRRNISLMKLLSILAPGAALGFGIGRIGCLLNGCCFGVPTDLPWGMVFPSTCSAGYLYPHQHIHPTQLYAIIYNFAIAAVLVIRRPHVKFEGELFGWLLALYGIFRFANETVRYYRPGMILLKIGSFDLTLSMVISLSMFVGGVLILLRGYKNRSTAQ